MRRLPLMLLLAALLGLSAPAAHAGPAALVDVDPAAAVPARSAPRALFFGDSYFVGGGCSPDAKQDMAYLAGVQLGYRPVVRGAGGTGFVAANPDYDLPPYLGQIHDGALDVHNPKLVVIEGGSNDVGLPIGQVRHHAGKVLRIARHLYPHAVLILVGPMDVYGGYDDSTPIRDALRSVAKGMHVPFVDDMKWTAGHDDWLCSDYDHPTYAAHKILGARLARALHRRGA